MDDKQPEKKRELRKHYKKPEVKKVRLKPEEAVLGGCKTASVAGPGQSLCSSLGGCSTIVS